MYITILLLYTTAKNILENVLLICLSVRTNLFVPSHFWTPDAKFDNCCWRCIAKGRKKVYECTSTFIARTAVDFLKSLRCLYEVVHTNFSADFFLTFHNV